jgi:serine/threonine-protein kinase
MSIGADTSVAAAFSAPKLPKSRPCVVPQVRGKSLKVAVRSIKAHGCGLGKVKRASSTKVKKGFVISQGPKAGRRLAHGAKVSLVVSKGR